MNGSCELKLGNGLEVGSTEMGSKVASLEAVTSASDCQHSFSVHLSKIQEILVSSGSKHLLDYNLTTV